MMLRLLLALLVSRCGASFLGRDAEHLQPADGGAPHGGAPRGARDGGAPRGARCPSLDRAQVLCRYGGVSVVAAAAGGNQRRLRFGEECATETVVNCQGAMPGGGRCDGGCSPCPCEFDDSRGLSAPYMTTMFENLGSWCDSPEESRVLMVGLGGGELPQYLLRKCPRMTVEAVELNGDVIHVAVNFFGLAEAQSTYGDRLTVEQNDALTAAEARPADRYDVVLVDCFAGGGEVPESCRSRRFAERIRAVLKPSGVMMQNIWHTSPHHPKVATEFHNASLTYAEVFGGAVDDISVPMPPRIRFVDILKATKL